MKRYDVTVTLTFDLLQVQTDELNKQEVRLCPPHLSAGRRRVSDLVSHLGEDGDEPALTVELLPQPPTDAAQQSRQQVLIASAELAVLQVVLQQPERRRHGITPGTLSWVLN